MSITLEFPVAAPRAPRKRAVDADRHVGARIRERRIMLGLSQDQVAGMIGVTYQQQHKRERGINRISAAQLYLTAQALGVEPAYFFEGLANGGSARADLAGERRWLDLAENFVRCSPDHQAAVAALARHLADAGA